MSRNPTISLPLPIVELEQTELNAIDIKQSLSKYARHGIDALEQASIHRFRVGSPDTFLLDSAGVAVQLPPLSDDASAKRLRAVGERFRMDAVARLTLPETCLNSVEKHARRLEITPEERMRRSLRFINFIVEHTIENPVFVHNDKSVTFEIF